MTAKDGHSAGDDRTINLPLETWAENLIDRALEKHSNRCPLRKRVERLEVRLSSLIAFMVGSGLLGGAAGAVLSNWMGR